MRQARHLVGPHGLIGHGRRRVAAHQKVLKEAHVLQAEERDLVVRLVRDLRHGGILALEAGLDAVAARGLRLLTLQVLSLRDPLLCSEPPGRTLMRRLLQLKHPRRLFVCPRLSCLALADDARTISELCPGCGELPVGELEAADERSTSVVESTSMSAVSSRRKAPKSKSPGSEAGPAVRSGSMVAWLMADFFVGVPGGWWGL